MQLCLIISALTLTGSFVGFAKAIGANDVVNPAARRDTSSPIYGMPIINADNAKMCSF